MTIVNNPDNDFEIINAQKAWLDVLQRVPPSENRPILIKVLEGATPENGDSDLYRWLPYTKIWYKVCKPIYTRGVTPNEILIDPDTTDWDAMRDGVGKLLKYCQENKIPYIAGFSGGKGIHVSIFFGAVNFDDELYEDYKKANIDGYKITRRSLLKAIADKAGVDLDKIKVDWGKVNFNIESKGTQVRDFGTTRAKGMYKTMITDIPKNKPAPYELPLVFPEKVELWEIRGTEFDKIAADAIREEIEKAKRSGGFILADADFSGLDVMQFPCMQKMYTSGIQNGRYYAGVALTLMCKKCGLTKEATEKNLVALFKTFRGLTAEETEIRITNALHVHDENRHFSCRKLKEMLGAEICNPAECPLKEQIEKEKIVRTQADIKNALESLVLSENDSERLGQAIDFMGKYLMDIDAIEAERIIITTVKKAFKLVAKELTLVMKAYKAGKRDMTKIETLGAFDLDSVSGRSIMVHTLTDEMLSRNHFKYAAGVLRVYDGGIYPASEDTEKKTQKEIVELALSNHSTPIMENHANYVIKMLEIKTAVGKDEYVQNADEIVVNNGVLNLKTLELKEFTPEKVFFGKMPVDYIPDAPRPEKFLRFVETCFRGNECQYNLMQEVMGYLLTNDYKHQVIIYLLGDGGNGKGTMLKIAAYMLGEDNISTASIYQLTDHNNVDYYIAGLHGKKANICGDVGPRRINNTENLKKLSSNTDGISGRHPYGKPFTFINTAKIIVAMNKLPKKDAFTTGDKRRDTIIRFVNRISDTDEEIKGLAEVIRDSGEMPGVLNWAIEGLKRLEENGGFSDNRTIADKGLEYDKLSNPMKHFVNDCVEENSLCNTPTFVVYEMYTKYRRQYGMPELSEQEIKNGLKYWCNEIGIQTSEKRKQKGEITKGVMKVIYGENVLSRLGNQVRVFTGIKVSLPWDEQTRLTC